MHRLVRPIRLPNADSGQNQDPSDETIVGGEGKAALAISQFSHNLLVSLNNTNTAKNLKLMQVEHACCAPTSMLRFWCVRFAPLDTLENAVPRTRTKPTKLFAHNSRMFQRRRVRWTMISILTSRAIAAATSYIVLVHSYSYPT